LRDQGWRWLRGGREDGDKMVFGGTNCSFRRVGAMVKGGGVLEGEVDRDEEGSEVRGGLVVKRNVRQRVRERARAEERDNRLEGRNIGGGGAGLHGVQVNVSMILVSCRRFYREAPGQIGGSPLGSEEGERVAVEGGVKRIGGDRGNLRD
jgi:hypothetical protein